MDYSVNGVHIGDFSTIVSGVTNNGWDVQPGDIKPALQKELNRGDEADASTVGLLQRSVTTGSVGSVQGVACAGTITNANPSRCSLRLAKPAGNTKKMQLIELLNLKESVGKLGGAEPQMSPELIQNLINFAGYILQLELPLYQSEIHSLLIYVNNIVRECSESDQPDVWSIKSSLKKIEHLYPAFLRLCHPGAFQLADHLMANGFINDIQSSLIGNYGVRTFIFEIKNYYPSISVSRFRQHVMPLIDNEEFKQLMADDPWTILCNKNDEIFQLWEIIVDKSFPKLRTQLLDKVFAVVFYWCDFPDALFIRNPDHFEQSLTADLDQYCKGSVADFEKGVSRVCTGFKVFGELS